MKLYSYYRSSAAYRVRIALNLKGLSYETIPVHLLKQGGEQLSEEYRRINPDGLVPVLIDSIHDAEHNATLTQSLAIIEYLEEAYPTPALLPTDLVERAWLRSVALTIACEIHPLNNLRVLRYLVRDMKLSEEDKNRWYRHWCEQGLASVETMLSRAGRSGDYCSGATPTLADCLLIPQIANAQRLDCDLSAMPTIMRINAHCLAQPAFIAAHPSKQPDAE